MSEPQNTPAPDALAQGFRERLTLLIQREPGRGKKQTFARKIAVKPQQLSRYLKGQIPDVRTLLTIAEVGHVSVDWLLTGREPGEGGGGAVPPSLLPGLQRLAQLPAPVLVVLVHVLDELETLGFLNQLL